MLQQNLLILLEVHKGPVLQHLTKVPLWTDYVRLSLSQRNLSEDRVPIDRYTVVPNSA